LLGVGSLELLMHVLTGCAAGSDAQVRLRLFCMTIKILCGKHG
jgi:hypothetical protein